MYTKIIFFILLIEPVFVSCNLKTNIPGTKTHRATVKNESDSDTCNPKRTVGNFLKWYKSNHERLYQIPLTKTTNTSSYRIESKNVDRFLGLLKSSELVSEKLLNDLKKYFDLCNRNFIKTKQNDGPPDGLDADLILYSQDFDIFLNNLNTLEYINIKNEGVPIKVEVKYKNDYDLIFEINENCLINRVSTVLTNPFNNERTEKHLLDNSFQQDTASFYEMYPE